MEPISTMSCVTEGREEKKKVEKLIQALKQLVIFELPDRMMNSLCGHLDHLSCLSKTHLITVREAEDGHRLLSGHRTHCLPLSLCLFPAITQTYSFVSICLCCRLKIKKRKL